ncbi:MAG: GNAT family N-acetyltransferase [Pirellulaceae bacterium]
MQLIEVENFTTGPPRRGSEVQSNLYESEPTGPQPDAHWVVVSDSRWTSRCSLWWNNTPACEHHRVGCIGHYAATDDETAEVLLAHVCGELRRRGCTLAVGPMDGSTWCNYRFVTDFGDRPRFWMEPDNPPEWPQQFVRHGFRVLGEYFSALNLQLDYRDNSLDAAARRIAAAGVTMRPICAEAFEADLLGILQVARTAFRHNVLYSDPDENDYLARSRRLRDLAPLQLTWLAEHCDRMVGFVLVLPDLCEQVRRSSVDTVVVKTLAVVPDRAYAGLGQLLLAHAQQHARDHGFSAAIHALMRDVGAMRRISGRYARPMRRYTLFAKVLQP